MATETIDSLSERLSRLEKEIAELRQEKSSSRPGVIGRTHPDFLTRYVGMFANDPAFDEMTRQLAEERERERAEARLLDDDADEPTP